MTANDNDDDDDNFDFDVKQISTNKRKKIFLRNRKDTGGNIGEGKEIERKRKKRHKKINEESMKGKKEMEKEEK